MRLDVIQSLQPKQRPIAHRLRNVVLCARRRNLLHRTNECRDRHGGLSSSPPSSWPKRFNDIIEIGDVDSISVVRDEFFDESFLTWNLSEPMRATGESLPSTSAKNAVVSDALFEHVNVNSEINPIWLTIVASCVVNHVDSTAGSVQVKANDAEITAESAKTNNNFDIFIKVLYSVFSSRNCSLKMLVFNWSALDTVSDANEKVNVSTWQSSGIRLKNDDAEVSGLRCGATYIFIRRRSSCQAQ